MAVPTERSAGQNSAYRSGCHGFCFQSLTERRIPDREEPAGLILQKRINTDGVISDEVPTHYLVAVPRIFRRNQFRKVTVSALPIPGVLPSQVLAPLMDKIKEFQRRLPPGYSLEFGGQYFGKLATVLDLVGQDLAQQGDGAPPAETLAGIRDVLMDL